MTRDLSMLNLPGWTWMPGMRVFIAAGDGSGWGRVREDGSFPPGAHPQSGSDLEDHATRGCFLELVRKAWAGRGYVSVRHPVAESLGEPWDVVVYTPSGDLLANFSGPSEVDALCVAFVAAHDKAAP